MKPGDPVYYGADALLYGEMEIAHVRSDGRLMCIVDPDAKRPSFEVFDAAELEVPVRVAA